MSSNAKDTDFAPINVDVSDRIPAGSKKSNTQTSGSGGSGSSTGKGLFILVLVVALIACAFSAYLFTELQKSQQTIVENQNRLQSLENRLSATGEEIGNSTVALQVKLTELSEKTEELWDQMDKLWASAWRRNQAEIKELNSDVVSLKTNVDTKLDDVLKKANGAQSSVAQLATRIDSLNSKITEQANNLLAAKVEFESFTDANSSQNSQIRELQEKILLLEKRNTNLLQELNALEAKVDELVVKTI
uniref:hypothetical protein n=1 Tax=Ningiella ruwaisensis TaxID=2364274 RepID=UPI00109FA3C8|nr:hypothetical protein [Ningiella ruwaisensis]